MNKIEIIEIIIVILKRKSSPFLDLYLNSFSQVINKAEFSTCIKDLKTEKFIDYEGNFDDTNDVVLTRFGEEIIKKYFTYSNYQESKSNETLYDKTVKWGKNNFIIVSVILILSFFAAIASFNDAFRKIFSIDLFQKDSVKPDHNTDETFTDSRDGKVYKIIRNNNQIWMAENLAYKANKGCWAYGDDVRNVAKYGYLYDWITAKAVCPDGWRLPTKMEYENLLVQFGGAGQKAFSNLIADKPSLFFDVFGGYRAIDKGYSYIDIKAVFWSLDEVNNEEACVLELNRTDNNANLNYPFKVCGFSIRCIKE